MKSRDIYWTDELISENYFEFFLGKRIPFKINKSFHLSWEYMKYFHVPWDTRVVVEVVNGYRKI